MTFAPLAYIAYKRRIHRTFAFYTVGLLCFLGAMAFAEQWGLPKTWMGAVFLFVTVGLYAAIGLKCRTADADEYYVAGRRIPAFYNVMATAADWMSAASFISLAGGLYLQGFSGSGGQPGGLAYVLGWTGGFCLVALLVAPHLRSLKLYTIPDYFAHRYGGIWPRRVAALATVACSFTYVVAQIYGVGLITSRLTGVHFEIGILLGLGGVLVCSFLGGMRAVTWTQVAQYVVMILAFLIPVSWLAYKQLGNPVAPWVYGQQLDRMSQLERELMDSPAEQQVIEIYAKRAKEYEKKLADVAQALETDRAYLKYRVKALMDLRASSEDIAAARRELSMLPKTPAAAQEQWTRAMEESLSRAKPLAGMPPHVQAFAGQPEGSAQEQDQFNSSRNNFIALVFCLMLGTVGLPHLLTRFYTTPSVSEARTSVAWSLLFIGLLYMAAPALAVLVKWEVMSQLVGQDITALPAWMAQWSRVDGSLISFADVNGDNRLQFSELKLGADILMLATPEIAGLPYVVSGLVAAGGLAAALSTADGLLLTIGNALSHDLAYQGRTDSNYPMKRVMLSKFALLVVALIAAYFAAQKSTGILNLVTASFSFAAAAFVPALIAGCCWPRATRAGALAGMWVGMGVTCFYIAINMPWVRQYWGLEGSGLWWGIQPVSAGVFGVAFGTLALLAISLLTPNRIARTEPDDLYT
jgi:cation/acetate symporter